MALSKETILSKTHYGLKIFSHVLRCHNSNTILSLKGRDCIPVSNPLLENSIIQIKIIDAKAQYQDINNPIIAGDVFDFAAQHFQLEGQELLEKIDQDLFLNLKEKEIRKETDWLGFKLKTVHIPEISFYKAPIKNVIPSETLDLYEVGQRIISEVYKQKTFTLRNLNDKAIAKAYKAQSFDYVTFSGTFSQRSDKHLLKHSGLIALDFDDLEEVEETKVKLLEDEYFETELLFTSPTGNGLKWIIPIDIKIDTHLNYLKALEKYVKQTYGLVIDPSGKDISRACFLPHDTNLYINPKYLK